MRARIVRLDAHYEVAFPCPTFSPIASFFQIIEPIYDAFSSELVVPSADIVVPVALDAEDRKDALREHAIDLAYHATFVPWG